jgi:hypothetical protein
LSIITNENKLINIYESSAENFYKQIDDFLKLTSDWKYDNINFLQADISKYIALIGSSYIDLPIELKKKMYN